MMTIAILMAGLSGLLTGWLVTSASAAKELRRKHAEWHRVSGRLQSEVAALTLERARQDWRRCGMSERKVLGWAVKWLDEPGSKGGGVKEWAQVESAPDTSAVHWRRSWASRKERTLLSESDAKAIAQELRDNYGEAPDSVAAVRIVARPKAPKVTPQGNCAECHVPGDVFTNLCLMLRKADSRCMVSEGVEATLARILEERSAPKPDKLEQAIAKIESVVAGTRNDLEHAKCGEEWSNVAAFYNQELAEANVLRILRGLK